MNNQEVSLHNENGIREVVGSHNPLAFLTKFPGPQSSYFVHFTDSDSSSEPIKLAPGVPDHLLLRQLAVNHEYFHFLQNIGTIYGASLRWAWQSQGNAIREIFTAAHLYYRSRGKKIIFPISAWPSSGDVELRRIATAFDTAYQCITVHLARHTDAWANERLKHLGIEKLRNSNLPVSPKVTLANKEFHLTGKAMLESHARLLEFMLLKTLVDSETEKRLLTKLAWPTDYYITWLTFHDLVSTQRSADIYAVIDFSQRSGYAAALFRGGMARNTSRIQIPQCFTSYKPNQAIRPESSWFSHGLR